MRKMLIDFENHFMARELLELMSRRAKLRFTAPMRTPSNLPRRVKNVFELTLLCRFFMEIDIMLI